jgi:hypothetical protein
MADGNNNHQFSSLFLYEFSKSVLSYGPIRQDPRGYIIRSDLRVRHFGLFVEATGELPLVA